MSFLEIKNLSKSYLGAKGKRQVLRDINLKMEKGQFICIVGYSGSGKTTLMNIVAGLLAPDSGGVFMDGVPVSGPSLERPLIFQNYSLLPWLTALRNVELAVAQCMPSASRSEITARSRAYLEKVKLGHALDRRPAELSGGMRQRVALARGLAMEGAVLLLDEPLGALDALTRAELQDEFTRIQQEEKRTILMITNDVDEAILLGDYIIPLSAGPGATLGDPVPVRITRPCTRQQLNYDPEYHLARKAVLHYLLHHGPEDMKRPKAEDQSRLATNKASYVSGYKPEPSGVAV